MTKNDRILVFGAGAAGAFFMRESKAGCEVVAVVDNDEEKWGTRCEGVPVIAPQDINAHKWDEIVIASMHGYEVFAQLNALGVSHERIRMADLSLLARRRETFLGAIIVAAAALSLAGGVLWVVVAA